MSISNVRYFIPGLLTLLYPPLFVFSLPAATAGWRELAAAMSAAAVLWLVLSVISMGIFRKSSSASQKAGLLATVLSVLAILYGHAYSLLYNRIITFLYAHNADNIPETLIKVSLEIFFLLVFFWALEKAYKGIVVSRKPLASKLHSVSLAFTSIMLALATFSVIQLNGSPEKPDNSIVHQQESGINKHPDIYHIILDGYARNDILKEFYGFDNHVFIEELENAGFTVSKSSRSNYGWTVFSLSSMLNMSYLTPELIEPGENLRGSATGLLQDSRVARNLKSMGYHYIHMASTWGPTLHNKNADIIHRCSKGVMQNDYFRVLIEGSLLRSLSFLASQNLADCHRENFHWLANGAKNTRHPAYVFAHFVLPHHPYLFDEQGNTLRNATLSDQFDFQAILWSDRDSYLAQLKYVNKEIIHAVKAILANSEQPPVIIIQSDHGPQLVSKSQGVDPAYLRGRSAIFLAINAPDATSSLPDSAINIYPWVFNHALNINTPYLPYHYFKTATNTSAAFEEVPISELIDTGKETAQSP